MLQSTSQAIASSAGFLKDKTNQILLMIGVIMLLIEYFGWQAPFFRLFGQHFSDASRNQLLLYAQAYTTIAFIFLMIVLPAIYIRFFQNDRLWNLGLQVPQLSDAKPYAAFAILMTAVLVVACSQPGFYQFYPLYKPQNPSGWLAFEAIYALQFIATEFFFRGPILFTLYKKMKDTAIFVMVIPYALIHIHKPLPEALGAVIAGIILGVLAIKSRSIWWGVALHIYIALLADTLGLFYSGRLMELLN